MLAYLDASVLLRVIFGEANRLKEFTQIKTAVSSELIRVETLRTIERIRHEKRLSEETSVKRIELFYKFQEKMDLIPIHREVLNRACQPFPVVVGSLDALHLASAILYRERISQDLVFCTHDKALSAAARVVGFIVLM